MVRGCDGCDGCVVRTNRRCDVVLFMTHAARSKPSCLFIYIVVALPGRRHTNLSPFMEVAPNFVLDFGAPRSPLGALRAPSLVFGGLCLARLTVAVVDAESV